MWSIFLKSWAAIALSIADYGYVMENGRIVLDGPAEKLKENEDVKEFYLGLSQVGHKKSYHDVKHYKQNQEFYQQYLRL